MIDTFDLQAECLKKFHEKYVKNDVKPEIAKSRFFKAMLNENYSGENLKAKIIDTDIFWNEMISSKGFGRGQKLKKASAYRTEMWMAWREISEAFESNDETIISEVIGRYIWGLNQENHNSSYLGVIESSILENKLWKNENMASIFVDYFGFIFNHKMTLDEIADKSTLTRERIRQLKEKCLETFDQKFVFFQDKRIKSIFDEYFANSNFEKQNIIDFTDEVSEKYGVNFTYEFFTKILSNLYNLHLIGNIDDNKSQISRSSFRNVWNNIYLQSKEDKEVINIEELINDLAVVVDNHRKYFKNNVEFPIKKYTTQILTNTQIKRYKNIIEEELSISVDMNTTKLVLHRNSHISKFEIIHKALTDLGGLAYLDDIVNQLNSSDQYDGEWDEYTVRNNIRRKDCYTIGKSRLYGLSNIIDVRDRVGNGTLNDIMRLSMEDREGPVHIFDLLEYTNNIFPRKKSINSITSILDQDSRSLFVKMTGGFYGLQSRKYEIVNFPKVIGFHGRLLRDILKSKQAVEFDDLFHKVNLNNKILRVQLKYLLHQGIESGEIIFDGDKYSYNLNYTNSDIKIEEEHDINNIIYDSLELGEYEDSVLNNLELESLSQVRLRRGQPRFRRGLLKLYKCSCIVTGCNVIDLLEAAHISPHSETTNFDLTNGILIRADIHTLFDTNNLAINPNSLTIALSEQLLNDSYYYRFQGLEIGPRVKNLHPIYLLNYDGLVKRWTEFMSKKMHLI